jgi:hypothetical protein
MTNYLLEETFNKVRQCVDRINFCNTFLNNNQVDREEESSQLRATLRLITDAYNAKNEDKQIKGLELSFINKSGKVYFIVIFDKNDEKTLSVDEFCDHFKKALDPLNPLKN